MTTIASAIWAQTLASLSRSQAGPADPRPGLAYMVKTYFDGLPVNDAVTAGDPLPCADGTQLRRGDRCLGAEAVQVLQVIAGTKSGMSRVRARR